MTLGYGPPRALCPMCAEEGVLSDQQHQQVSHGSPRKALTHSYRFRCTQGHAWLTPKEDAELMGAFLNRQRS